MAQIVQRVAVKAVIINEHNQVLLLRKSNDDERHAGKSGRYNLPGGKINPGEKIEDALRREVREEVSLVLNETSLLPVFVGEWRPVVRGIPHQIVGVFFACRNWTGEIALDSEHDVFVWVGASEVSGYDILPPEDEALQQYFAVKNERYDPLSVLTDLPS